MKTQMQMVKEFHEKFGHEIDGFKSSISKKEDCLSMFARVRFMLSELSEFTEAAQQNDLAGMYDALIDLLYFIFGTAVVLGVDLEPGFAAVHEANMQKSKAKDAGGKTIKPDGWREADLKGILREQGFNI
jgi:predicted HAD superfamily Cof-like phosphohydrolase